MRRALQILASIALSALFVWLSLRGVDLAKVGAALSDARPGWIVAAFAAGSLGHVVRVARWGLLLEPLTRAGFWRLNPLGAVGFMLLMVLPLRLGELARPYLASEYLGVRKSAAMASVVVERVVDGLAFGLLMIALLWTVSMGSGVRVGPAVVSAQNLRAGAVLAGGVFGALAAALVVAYRHRDTAGRVVRATLGRLSPKLGTRVADMLEAFTEGLAVLPSGRKIALYFAYTVAFWGFAALGLMLAGRAFAMELGPGEAFSVLTIQVMGAMIPSGPGMIGTSQFFTQLGLELFAPGRATDAVSVAYANTSWALNFGQQVAFGLYFVAIGRVQMAGLLAQLGLGSRRAPAHVRESASALDAAERVAGADSNIEPPRP